MKDEWILTGDIDASGRGRRAGDKLRPDPGSDQLGQLKLANTFQNIQPRMAEVVAVCVGDRDERFDGIDVFRFDLRDGWIGREQREASQCLDESICNNTINDYTWNQFELDNFEGSWKAPRSSDMWKMQAIRMAQRMPSRHREETSKSSQSCKPTLNEARNGVQANWNSKKQTKMFRLNWYDFRLIRIIGMLNTLNMGRTWSECVAEVNGEWTWLTDSINCRAVDERASISMLNSKRRFFSLFAAD